MFFFLRPNLSNSNQFAYSNNLVPSTPNQSSTTNQYLNLEAQIKQPEFRNSGYALAHDLLNQKFKPKPDDNFYPDSYQSMINDFPDNSHSPPEADIKLNTSTPSTSHSEDLTLPTPSLHSFPISNLPIPNELTLALQSINQSAAANSYHHTNMSNSHHHAMSAYLKSNPYAMNSIAGITSAGDLLHSGYPGKYITLLTLSHLFPLFVDFCFVICVWKQL